ncbi:uncharacterized protein [Haliotis asinina]|uniref:uncharacterized protein n=1 Tax=Haliotis asinina TaxID=109174 RepID=UPI00353208DF
MDGKDIQCQGDMTPQDPPNSVCTVIFDNLPESKSESNLHLETSAVFDESCLRKRKRILLSCHKQILAKVREQRLMSKNRQMFSQRFPASTHNDEQCQNDTGSSPLIVSVRPISQTASGSMKLSYTIKDGWLSTSLQKAGQSIKDDTSISNEINQQEAGSVCLGQLKIKEYPKENISILAETNLPEVRPMCLGQVKITEHPKEDTGVPAERNHQGAGLECLEQTRIPGILEDDPIIPARINLQEVGLECLEQTRIPGILEDDPNIPAGTILPEVWAERLEQIGIPVCLHGNQKVPAETIFQLAGVEYLGQLNMPEGFQDDPIGHGRALGEIQTNCSSSLENLEWVSSLGPEHAITVLYTSPSVDNGTNNEHDNKLIEEQYLQPVKKRKVKK